MTRTISLTLHLLLFSALSFARPFPSTGQNINCSLDVKQVSGFTPCSYDDHCPIVKSEALVRFQTLTGDLSRSLNGSLHIKEVQGFREANGGPLSPSTIALVNYLKQQALELEINYIYSEPRAQFSARLSSSNSPKEFKVEIKKLVDFKLGSRENGALSNFVKLSNDPSSEGLFGHLYCSPEKKP